MPTALKLDTYGARLLATVRHDAFMLRKIDRREWTEELLLAAVSRQGGALRLIPEPSHAVVLAAVTEDGDALQYVSAQTEEICLAACRQWVNAVHHIVDDEMRERVLEQLVEDGLLAENPYPVAANVEAYRA